MRVVDQAIKQRVGDTAGTEIIVPGFERQLRCDHGRAGPMPFFGKLKQILLFGFRQRREAEVVEESS